MNRKLHNSISALMAAGGALVLGLVILLPLPGPLSASSQNLAPFDDDAPATRPLNLQLGVVKAEIRFSRSYLERARARSGDVANAARKIEASVAKLENAANPSELAMIAGALAGDVADLSAMANAIEPIAAAEPVGTEPKRKAGNASRRNRSNLVMPYFSFLSRG